MGESAENVDESGVCRCIAAQIAQIDSVRFSLSIFMLAGSAIVSLRLLLAVRKVVRKREDEGTREREGEGERKTGKMRANTAAGRFGQDT